MRRRHVYVKPKIYRSLVDYAKVVQPLNLANAFMRANAILWCSPTGEKYPGEKIANPKVRSPLILPASRCAQSVAFDMQSEKAGFEGGSDK